MRWLWSCSSMMFCLACHKGDPSPPLPCGPFTGIVQRDISGQAFGPGDGSDWAWKEDWCPEAESLFADRPTVELDTMLPDSFLAVAFPNPAEDRFMLGFLRDDPSYVDFRIVNEQFQHLYSTDSMIGDLHLVDMDSIPGPRPQNVRVYYRLVHADGTAHRGHGDVRITE
ncbi:MAG: hypothetical protein JNL43_17200 [Flavobacteriales bacterium]|nr:hypothetical protein [Flavobacteriales bacterium]